jgi:Protein of unknwon function (DUF3310)
MPVERHLCHKLDCAALAEPKSMYCGAHDPMRALGQLAKPGTPHDPVNAPSHYTATKIAAIAVIEDWKLGFNLGQVIKYIARAPHKGGLEDLRKAQWYLAREIQREQTTD